MFRRFFHWAARSSGSNAPASIAGPFQFGTAAFGPAIGNPSVSANVVAVADAVEVGGTDTDGCSPFSNAGAVAGSIALIERGFCGFAVKARNATDAGAVAAIIYNNLANVNGGPPGMADDNINGVFVLIPTVSLRRADGLAILGELGGGVSADIGLDQTVRAGADALNRARVYAPFPVSGGSSISHYDTVARRNLLMEPAINGDLTHNVKAPFDLTFELLRDVGWTFPDADGDGVVDDEDCNANSDRRATIVIGDNDSGVPNHLFANGCTSADLIAQIAAAASNHGGFVSGVAHLTNTWKSGGLVPAARRGRFRAPQPERSRGDHSRAGSEDPALHPTHAPDVHDRVASPRPPGLRQHLRLLRRDAAEVVAHRDVFLRKGVGPAQRAHRDVVRRPRADPGQLGQPPDRVVGIVMRAAVEAQRA